MALNTCQMLHSAEFIFKRMSLERFWMLCWECWICLNLGVKKQCIKCEVFRTGFRSSMKLNRNIKWAMWSNSWAHWILSTESYMTQNITACLLFGLKHISFLLNITLVFFLKKSSFSFSSLSTTTAICIYYVPFMKTIMPCIWWRQLRSMKAYVIIYFLAFEVL